MRKGYTRIKSGENNTLSIQICAIPDAVIGKPEQDACQMIQSCGDPKLW
ncbi:hypothetical protein [Kiloniella litopenaei]